MHTRYSAVWSTDGGAEAQQSSFGVVNDPTNPASITPGLPKR